jgi:hypothetical protein
MRGVFRKLWAVLSAASTLQWAGSILVAGVTLLVAVAFRVLHLGVGWVITAAVGVLLVLIAAVLFALPHVRRWFGPRIDLGRFADECERLSRQIHEFMAERTINQPSFRSPTAKTDQGRRRQWATATGEQGQYLQGTMAKYQQKFAAEAFTLWHDAVAAGLVGDKEFVQERHSFERGVVTTFGMDEVARVLAVLAQRAKRKIRDR